MIDYILDNAVPISIGLSVITLSIPFIFKVIRNMR
jgi:hypothetical protein